jgi:hypothetical protein
MTLDILNWIIANWIYVAIGLGAALVVGLGLYWYLFDRKRKAKATAALYNDTDDRLDNNTPNTIIINERDHKRARKCFVNYASDPDTPLITMPDDKQYYIFIEHDYTEGNEALLLPSTLENTPEDYFFADHDEDTGGLFPATKTFWEKALVGMMLILIVILVVLLLCVFGK